MGIVHGAIATIRYLVNLDPSTRDGCPLCFELETVYRPFVQCYRLEELFRQLQRCFSGLGESFYDNLFIFGPYHCAHAVHHGLFQKAGS